MQRLASLLLGSAATLLALSLAARAADLPARSAPVPSVAALPIFTWTGFYIGVNAGYGFTDGNTGFYDPIYGAVTASSDSNGGFVGGGQVGFNYQLTPGAGLVIGLEADLQATSLGGRSVAYTVGTTPYYELGSSIDWFGTVRGRVGYAFDRVMIYGTGGLAYGGGSTDTSYASLYPYTLSDSTRIGYAAGGGIEYALTNTISAKIEGLYVSLDRGNAAASTIYDAGTNAYYGPGKTSDDFGVIRAGLNFKFSSF